MVIKTSNSAVVSESQVGDISVGSKLSALNSWAVVAVSSTTNGTTGIWQKQVLSWLSIALEDFILPMMSESYIIVVEKNDILCVAPEILVHALEHAWGRKCIDGNPQCFSEIISMLLCFNVLCHSS